MSEKPDRRLSGAPPTLPGMSTYISDSSIEWKVLAADGEARQRAAWDYALGIFPKASAVAEWFAGYQNSVLNGGCTVAEACRTAEGFVETISELVRIGMTLGCALPRAAVAPRTPVAGNRDIRPAAPVRAGGAPRVATTRKTDPWVHVPSERPERW